MIDANVFLSYLFPSDDLDAIIEAMADNLLLPSDALIVAACIHNGIESIATFDSDFKRLKGFAIIGEESG